MKICFKYDKPILAPDPINASGKEKIKTYFNIKLNEITKDILNNLRFPSSGIDTHSMKITLINGTSDNKYHPYGEVRDLSGLSVWETGLDGVGQYAINAGLEIAFECDQQKQDNIKTLSVDMIKAAFREKHKTVVDSILCGEIGTGEYLRYATPDETRTHVYFTIYLQMLLNDTDIK